jgi:N-acetyl sugar amidotransferase
LPQIGYGTRWGAQPSLGISRYELVMDPEFPMPYPYQICQTCIMDTTDPGIRFDADGRCDYCVNFDTNLFPSWQADLSTESKLLSVAEAIRNQRKGQDFDCIIGLSGGLDSSYTAYIAKEKMGLRPLLFHVDAGWNTDQAVGNIEKLVDGLGLDLYTEVIDWEEMKDLQVAFLRSQISDQDIPQDAAFFSALYKFARKNKIKHILTGANYSTECCREPEEWGGYPGIDKRLILDIHARFGRQTLRTFPLVDIFTYKVLYQRVLGMEVVKPLNLVRYVKQEAEATLARRFGWKKFQHKHHESRFTRFYEDYWMPRKFGFHKRRAHFSSLIMTGQMPRDEAIVRLSRPEMDEHFLNREFEYVANKLDLSSDELRLLFNGSNKTYHDYKNRRALIGLGSSAMQRLGMEKRLFR